MAIEDRLRDTPPRKQRRKAFQARGSVCLGISIYGTMVVCEFVESIQYVATSQ